MKKNGTGRRQRGNENAELGYRREGFIGWVAGREGVGIVVVSLQHSVCTKEIETSHAEVATAANASAVHSCLLQECDYARLSGGLGYGNRDTENPIFEV